MSEINDKFCEECGKKSSIDVKFCKYCGAEFPVIDHPAYVKANTPQQYQQPPQQPQYIDQSISPDQRYQTPPSQQPPSTQQQYPPQQQYQPPAYAQQPVQQYFSRRPPRVWGGGGLFQASKAMYSHPVEAAPGLIEDPQAPNSTWLIFLTAIIAAITQYYMFLKIDITEVASTDTNFIDTYNSSEGIKTYATSAAITGFLVVFLSWFLLSWLLSVSVRGGIPPDSYLQNAPTKSMRQLTGFLYIPTIFRNVIQLILIQFENNRDVRLEKGGSLAGTDAPTYVYLTSFSDTYFTVMLVVTLVLSIITAITLYRSIKLGLNHKGITPAIAAGLIILFPIIYPPY